VSSNPYSAINDWRAWSSPRLVVSLARSRDEVREAQRLRYRVFVEEMGARVDARTGVLETDRFDDFCEHVVLRDHRTGRVVGTYRLLTPDRAAQVGMFMAEREFDLGRLLHLRGMLLEVGRACVHPDYRLGSAIMSLWSGIARYMQARRYQYVFGCVSHSMRDGGRTALTLHEQAAAEHLAPAEYRVAAHTPLTVSAAYPRAPVVAPPLLKGYLRLGAWICGEPAWDPEFNTADLLVLLPLVRVEARYARHFLRRRREVALPVAAEQA
jgi:putative hemolysin